jgi:hypothetical protein
MKGKYKDGKIYEAKGESSHERGRIPRWVSWSRGFYSVEEGVAQLSMLIRLWECTLFIGSLL